MITLPPLELATVYIVSTALGAVPSPFDCYMALRGIKTLHIRMREHEKNALIVARFLESHPKVTKVIYPGTPIHFSIVNMFMNIIMYVCLLVHMYLHMYVCMYRVEN